MRVAWSKLTNGTFRRALYEPLKENLTGFWSRRIDETNRLVYCVEGDDLVIIACRYHYDD